MKILITGATGLIGQKLVNALVRKGYENIHILTRHVPSAKKKLPYPLEFHQWENSEETLPPSAATQETNVVLNLAGESVAKGMWTHSQKNKIYSSRVMLTHNLVEGLKGTCDHVSQMISSSAIGYYGDRGDEELTEKSGAGNSFLTDVCEDWEAEASETTLFKNIALVRTGIVLASEGGALNEIIKPFQWGIGGRLGDGKQWMSWIHIDDLVEVFVHIIENKFSGIVNAVAPENVTNQKFSEALAAQLGVPAKFHVPKFVLKNALGEKSSLLLYSQRVQPEFLMQKKFNFKYSTLDSAFKDLLINAKCNENTFVKRQWVPDQIENVFEFFSDEKNLERITPEFLNFKVMSKSSDQLQKGTTIDYSLKIHGVPVKWRSEITEWDKDKKFTDVQLKGPYKKWHHQHIFYRYKNGTVIEDIVRYKVPLGMLGRVVSQPFVKKDLRKIFSYRSEVISNHFGSGKY